MLATMTEPPTIADGPPPRSPELFEPESTVLLVVDVQERLMRAQPRADEIAWNIRRLLDAASTLGVRVVATEQSPDKLGPTLPVLREKLDSDPIAKVEFSAAGCRDIWDPLAAAGVDRVVVCGIETHVCIAQSALDLLSAAYRVAIPVDAVGSRFALDHSTALARLSGSGATLTTTEAMMFEWCREAGTPQFKKISELAKESPASR